MTVSTPLAKKFGIKPDTTVLVLDPPAGFLNTLDLPDGVRLVDTDHPDDIDVAVLFCRSRSKLESSLRRTAARIAPAGGLWVAWPKKASGIETDLDFMGIQNAGLELGLVDNKVCAIDEVFSGVRFVVRREHRQAWASGQRL